MTLEYSQFLGNFFVITDKFIILTIKLIKCRAHGNCFLREVIFGATGTSLALCPELSPACCPGPLCLRARGEGRGKSSISQLWGRTEGAHLAGMSLPSGIPSCSLVLSLTGQNQNCSGSLCCLWSLMHCWGISSNVLCVP